MEAKIECQRMRWSVQVTAKAVASASGCPSCAAMSSFGSTEEVGAAKPLLVEVAISVCYPLASTTSGTPRARPRFSRAQRALEPPLREGLAGPGGAVVAGIRA